MDRWTHLPTSSVLSDLAWTDDRYERVPHAWEQIDQSHAASHEQVCRIWEDLSESQKLFDSIGQGDREATTRRRAFELADQAIFDAHYLLVCWYMIARSVYVIADATQFPGVVAFAKAQHAHLKHPGFEHATDPKSLGWYGDGRDQFAHYDQRIPGGDKVDKTKLSTSLPTNLPMERFVMNSTGTYTKPMIDADGMLIIGDKRWDVTSESQKRLTTILRTLNDTLRAEAITAIEDAERQRSTTP